MKTTFFNIRKLTVSALFVKNKWKKQTISPKLIISGVWMQKAGFEIGGKVTVSVSENLLIITKLAS